jgi:hypothetical protein
MFILSKIMCIQDSDAFTTGLLDPVFYGFVNLSIDSNCW